jgi:hypothetical protein
MSADSYKLEDVMRAALTTAVVDAALTNPLRCPKRMRLLVGKVQRKRKGSTNYIRAMENLRKSATDYVIRHSDSLPAILGENDGH